MPMKAILLAALLLLTVLAIVPAADARPLDPQCMEVYSRTNVGDYAIVRRNSCAPPEVYQCPYAGAPISECEYILR